MTDSRMPFVTAQKALSSGTGASRLSGKTAVAERHIDHDGPAKGSTEGVGSSAYHRDKGAGFAPSDYEYADIDGAQTAYVRMGRGEPVLLLHGVGSYSYMWRNVVPSLTDRFEVIVPDLLGCGYSSKAPNKPLDLYAQYEQIRRLVQTLGLASFHLVGHDFGGAVAQLLAIHVSQQVETLMLVNSLGYDYWPVRAIKTARFPIVRQFTIALLDKTVYASMLRRAVYDPKRLTNEIIDQYKLPYRSPSARRALIRLMRSLEHRYLVSVSPRLKHLTVPTLVVRAVHDAYLNRAIAVRLAEDIPTARLIEVEEAGHFIQEDRPDRIAELFLELALPRDGHRTR